MGSVGLLFLPKCVTKAVLGNPNMLWDDCKIKNYIDTVQSILFFFTNILFFRSCLKPFEKILISI